MKKGEIPHLLHDDLETAKETMLKAREEYLDIFKRNPRGATNNAVFGALDKHERYLLERKHLNHHFGQFGIFGK